MVNARLEELKSVWEERFEDKYGPWRPAAEKHLLDLLACGDVFHGLARIGCETEGCKEEYLRALSCQRRICPSCNQKRSLLFGEWISEEILDPGLPYLLWTFTIPKALRFLFLREPRLLSEIARAAWWSLEKTHKAALPEARPGAVLALQTHGDLLQ